MVALQLFLCILWSCIWSKKIHFRFLRPKLIEAVISMQILFQYFSYIPWTPMHKTNFWIYFTYKAFGYRKPCVYFWGCLMTCVYHSLVSIMFSYQTRVSSRKSSMKYNLIGTYDHSFFFFHLFEVAVSH